MGEVGVASGKSFEQIASIEGLSLTFIIIRSSGESSNAGIRSLKELQKVAVVRQKNKFKLNKVAMEGLAWGVANIGMWACADELVRECIKTEVSDGEERVYERNNI